MGVRLPSGSFTRNIFRNIEDIPGVRKKYKNRGVYVSAYSYTDAKKKSILYGDLYIDLDITDLKDVSIENEAFEKIREDAIKSVSFISAIFGIDEDMIKIYYSGQKGLHIIVPAVTFGLKPMKELNHIYRLIAEEIHKFSKHKTIDIRIYDNARLFSLPGGIHPETGRYKIPLSYSELRHLPFQDIKELSKQRRTIKYKRPRLNQKADRIFQGYIKDWEKEKESKKKRSKTKFKRKLDFCPPCIQDMLERSCTDGTRNNTAAILSFYFRQRGVTEEKAWKKLKVWNSEYAKLPERELDATFRSIFFNEYEYGCHTLAQFGDCDQKNCKIGKAVLKKQEEKKHDGRTRKKT